MNELAVAITPFLTKTTAIMSAVIILILIGAFLVSVEKEINRGTVEKFISTIKRTVFWLICLEGILSLMEFAQYCVKVYFKFK